MLNSLLAVSQQEILFKKAYSDERKCQELQGVVCISPEQIHARMPFLNKSEFETLFQHMLSSRYIWIAKGIIQEKIVGWIE
jgi:hypothetical protein